MILTIFLAIFLVILTFLFHYRMLLWLSVFIPYPNFPAQARVLFIVMTVFLAHIIEIAIYAGAYTLSIELFELGNLKGMAENDSMEYLYFSSVIYTSLGIGDIHPTGHIRFLTGIEALNGLLLIALSAAFAFLAMRRLWPWIECCDTDNKSSRGK